MKKLTMALIALLLVCTCAFATISATAGFGFGGLFIKDKAPVGPAFFASFDYETAYGISVYDDIAFNLTTGELQPKTGSSLPHYHVIKDEYSHFVLTENAGAGYTFHFDGFSLMAGLGLDVKYGVKTYKVNYTNQTKSLYFGVNARIKGTFHINEQWGVAVQLSPSYDFYQKANSVTDNPNLLTGNAFVGAVYQF